MSDIRIDHGSIITMDPDRQILTDASLVIEGDRIKAIGPTNALASAFPAAKVIDAGRMAVLPGLIDAHAHAGHSLIRSMGGEDNAEWYRACDTVYRSASDEGFWHAAAALSALERLKCGVTTGVSLLGGGNNVMRMDGPGCAEAHIDAIVSVGVRDVLAVGPMHPPHPTEFTRWIEGAPVQVAVSFDAQIETSATLIDRWHGRHESRTLVALLYPTVRPEHRAGATSETLTLMAEQAKATWALSRSRDVVFMQDGHTRGTVSYHHDMGIIGPNTLLSHATDITDKEVAICAETGCSIAHNPSAFASIYGRCPVPELMTAGVNVALGSDAAAPDRSHDMFRHMVHCLHYHRRHARDHRALAPGQVLEMATINAACALGLENETGSLEVGKKADVILVDLAKPHLAPMNMPHYRVVCFANGADVDTVIVGGKVLMSGRSVLSVAEDAVLAEAERATELFLKRTGFHAMTDVRPDFFGR